MSLNCGYFQRYGKAPLPKDPRGGCAWGIGRVRLLVCVEFKEEAVGKDQRVYNVHLGIKGASQVAGAHYKRRN